MKNNKKCAPRQEEIFKRQLDGRLLYLAFLLLCLRLPAASEPIRGGRRPPRGYFLLEATGNVLYVPNTGALGVGFPYTTSTKAGVSQHYFSNRYVNLFAGPFVSFGAAAQIPLKKRHFLDVGFGIGGTDGGKNNGYFFAGYGQKIFSNDKFRIKATIDVAYYEFTNALGAIDNSKKNISLLGTVADSTFSVNHSRSQPTVSYASVLKIQYLQKDYILIPKVSFEYVPFEGNRLTLGLAFSYLVPIYEKGNIRLEQEGSSGSNGSSFPLTASGLSLTYNNTPITTTPYHFHGLQTSFKIGLIVGKPPALTRPQTK